MKLLGIKKTIDFDTFQPEVHLTVSIPLEGVMDDIALGVHEKLGKDFVELLLFAIETNNKIYPPVRVTGRNTGSITNETNR
jgi:hypothetical protein